MRTNKILFLIISGLVFTSFKNTEPIESGYSIAKRMFEKTSSINSLTYTITKQERIKGKMTKQVSFTKMIKEPFKVYLRQQYPKAGTEILYVEGKNNNKALINPNGFPWINLKLNPREGIMRNNQHHTLFQSGFDHVVSILEFLSKKYNSEIENLVINNGIINYKNRDCYSISLSNPYFEYIDYTVSGNETVIDIATRYKLSAHMILEINNSIKDYDDIVAGQVIKIPNDYSPKMLLYVDKDKLIPVRMDIYDDKGLYEKYEYSEVKINPNIASEEFAQDYPEYGF